MRGDGARQGVEVVTAFHAELGQTLALGEFVRERVLHRGERGFGAADLVAAPARAQSFAEMRSSSSPLMKPLVPPGERATRRLALYGGPPVPRCSDWASSSLISPSRISLPRNCTVSWLMSIPRSASRSSTLRSESGYRTYIITTRRITSGDTLNPPDVRITRIRLSDKTSRLRPRHVVPKPAQTFRSHDLAARVRVAELRRFNSTARPRYYRHGPLAFGLFKGTLAIDGLPIDLSSSERTVLMLLASQTGTVATYDRLFSELGLVDSWKSRQALRSCVFGLRRKIERDSARPEILMAEVGVGYRLAASMDGLPYRATDPPSGKENWG